MCFPGNLSPHSNPRANLLYQERRRRGGVEAGKFWATLVLENAFCICGPSSLCVRSSSEQGNQLNRFYPEFETGARAHESARSRGARVVARRNRSIRNDKCQEPSGFWLRDFLPARGGCFVCKTFCGGGLIGVIVHIPSSAMIR